MFHRIRKVYLPLLSFQARHPYGVFISLILLLSIEALFEFILFPRFSCTSVILALMMLGITFVVSIPGSILQHRFHTGIKSSLLFVLTIGHLILFLTVPSNDQSQIALYWMVFVLILDAVYILMHENLPSLIFLIFKIITFSFLLFFIFHQDKQHSWGQAGQILQSIANVTGDKGGAIADKFLGIAMSAGGILVFKDGLDALGTVPYGGWNTFTNKALRMRKSFALIISSGYLICLSLFLWGTESNKFFASAIAVLSIITSECVAKLPIPSEDSICRAIASNILDKSRIPLRWEFEKRLCQQVKSGNFYESENLRKQLKKFYFLWYYFAKKADVNHQAKVLKHMCIMIESGMLESRNTESFHILMFSVGMLCAPCELEVSKAIAHIRYMESDSFHFNGRKEFYAGMRCGCMVLKSREDREAFRMNINISKYANTIMELYFHEKMSYINLPNKYERDFILQIISLLKRYEEVVR